MDRAILPQQWTSASLPDPQRTCTAKLLPRNLSSPFFRSFSSTTHLTLIYMRINSAESFLPQKAHCVKTHQVASFSRIRRQLLNPETAPTTSMSLEVFFLERQEAWLWVSYYTLEDFVVLFICPVFSSLHITKAYVTWVGWTQPFNYLPKESGLSPPQLENKPKTAGHNNENSRALVYQSFQLPPTPPQTPLLFTLNVTSISA